MKPTFILFLCLLGCIASTTMEETPADLALGDTPCLEHMRHILTPEGVGDLIQMALNSGKGVNQLGDFEACNTDNFDYALVTLVLMPIDFPLTRLGVCVPRSCNTHDQLSGISKFLEKTMKPYLPEGMEAEARVVLPREVLAEPMSSGAIVVLSVIGVIVFLWFLGMLVSFTNIGNNGNPQSEKIEEYKSKWALALHSFNPVVNLQKLFTVKQGGDQTLNVLNGVRVLSIGWVILGHSFSFVMFSAITNGQTLSVLYDSDLFSIVPGGVFAVDSFFFLSGFLTFALLISKMYPKRGMIGLGNTFLLYFHRYYRLIFPLVFIQFFTMFVPRYFGSGPLYRTAWDFLAKACFANPWSNFLFIANFVPWGMNDACIGWVWYLMNDMQFFIISPPLIMLYCMNKKIGKLVIFAMVAISMITNGVLAIVWDISIAGSSDVQDNVADYIYTKPWSRMGAYFVGALFGVSYFELVNKEKYQELASSFTNKIYEILRRSQIISLAVCLFGIGLTALYVFPSAAYGRSCGSGGQTNCTPIFWSFLYNMTSRPFFVLGVGLIIAPTFVGRLRVIKAFLGAETFAVLARLNYMVYMIHCVVVFHFLNDVRAPVYVTFVSQIFFAIGCAVISFMVAVPLTLICEVPFMNLEKYVLFPKALKAKSEAQYEPLEASGMKANANKNFQNFVDHDETLESKKNLLGKSEKQIE